MLPNSAVSVTEIPNILRQTARPFSVEVGTDYRAFIERDPAWNRMAEAAGIDYQFRRDEWVRGI